MQKPGFLARLMTGARYAIGATTVFQNTADGTPRGARSGRRSALFEQDRRHINSAIMSAGPVLRSRSRFLCRESGYVRNMKRVWTNHAVSTGWMPSVLGASPTVTKALHDQYKAWTDVADFDALIDFAGQQAMLADEEFEAGEIFFRMIPDADDILKLQAIPSEQLPYWNAGANVAPGNILRLGIEFDPKGQRVAYHFYEHNPGDLTYLDAGSQLTKRVPAEEILHIFTPTQPGQVRGLPRTVSAIVPMFKLEEYEDAALERAAVASKYAGFIKKTSTDGGEGSTGGTDNGDGSRSFNMETGVIWELDADEDWIDSSPPDPGANYDDFTRRMLAKGCSAVGVPDTESTNDLQSANYSSARIGRMPFKRTCEQWGHSVLVFQFLRQVWGKWLTLGLLSGKITLPRGASRDPAKYSNLRWLPPKWDYVDPFKDVQTDGLMVDHGFKARSDVIEEQGYSAEETDAKIKEDQDRANRLGLVFATTIPTSPSHETDPSSSDQGSASDGSGGPNPPAPKKKGAK